MNRDRLYINVRPQDRDKNWSYALPESIYNQILKHDVNSTETKILFEILAEQISLFTAPEIDWNKWEKYTYYEREKSNYRRNLMHNTVTIQSRLIQVVNKLKSEKRFKKYHYLLPDIEFDYYGGRQKYFKLNLTDASTR